MEKKYTEEEMKVLKTRSFHWGVFFGVMLMMAYPYVTAFFMFVAEVALDLTATPNKATDPDMKNAAKEEATATPGRLQEYKEALKYFNNVHENAMTRNGKINVDSSYFKPSNGHIVFKTEEGDGSKRGQWWEVSWNKFEDGTYKYGTPKKLED